MPCRRRYSLPTACPGGGCPLELRECYGRPVKCPFFPGVLWGPVLLFALPHPALKGIADCTKSWESRRLHCDFPARTSPE